MDSHLSTILILAVLLCLSAFFSASETALTGANRIRLKNQAENGDKKAELALTIIGRYDGAEIVQIYLSGKNCDVVMPLIELKAYQRIELSTGEKKDVTIEVPAEAFFYYDSKMSYGMHDGDYTVSVRTSSTDIKAEFEVRVRSKKVESKA